MKKLLFAVCAVAALSLAACHKDPVTPDNPGGGGNQQEEQIPEGEGIFNPGWHISAIYYNDGTPSEIWRWENRKLVGIDTSEYCGGSSPASTFSYNGWRLSQATTTVQGAPVTVSYSYTGDKLGGMTVTSQGMPVANMQLFHTGDKITSMVIDVNNDMLQLLLDLIGQGGLGDLGGFDFAVGPLATVLGSDLTASMMRSTKAAGMGDKLSVHSTEFNVYFLWTGDNVNRVLFTADIEMGITGEELSQIMSLDSSMAVYATLLQYVAGDQELPLNVTIADTLEYTYDDHANPMKGFFGKLEVGVLSANNVTTSTSHGMMNADVTITLPIIGDRHIPFSQSLGDGETKVNVYSYNAGGYPATVECSDGKQLTYNYQEQ